MTTQTHNSIHVEFLNLCGDLYKNSSPAIKRNSYPHRSFAYSTTLLFLKHIAVANQLTKDWNNLEYDLTYQKYTPATLLANALYSRQYIKMLLFAQIHKHMRLASEILDLIPTSTIEN